ncbi:unnamed protein product [Ilex paraguariensis]|uniref:Uncharacterized protein n=1 Tax=Ilex paraguariensis TaxID=185542 RepID=A0ABC8S7C4_9AQUA
MFTFDSVIPRFNGAYYVYKSLVHLCLSVDLQAVVKWLNKPKDEVPLKPETFLALVETYVQKYGMRFFVLDAHGIWMTTLSVLFTFFLSLQSKDSNSNLIVEEIKLVANAEENEVVTTIQFNEANIVQKDVKIVEPKEKNAAAAVKSCKQPSIAQKDVKAVEPLEKNAAAAAKRVSLLSMGTRNLVSKASINGYKEAKFLCLGKNF